MSEDSSSPKIHKKLELHMYQGTNIRQLPLLETLVFSSVSLNTEQ